MDTSTHGHLDQADAMTAPKLTEAQRRCLAAIRARQDSFVLHNAVPVREADQLYALGFVSSDWRGRNYRITDAGRAALKEGT
jgi:hypothetical protein